MWYEQFEFAYKTGRLERTSSLDCLYSPLTAEEVAELILEKPNEGLSEFKIPRNIYIPNEYIELLYFSSNGIIINGEREFGYFPLDELRKFYFCYSFFLYAPLFLPVAFNGGGVFYAYDFRDACNVRIVAVSAGDLSYDSAVDLGTNLAEVLKCTENIDVALSAKYPPPVLSVEQERKNEIRDELRRLKEGKENNSIDLKTYLKEKRRLEDELKTFH